MIDMIPPLISVIIPVYNTPEAYLKRCIDSLLVHENDKTEIVIVDDGSSLENSEQYRRLKQLSDNIIYLHQENAGVSAARNLGLDFCKGEYVAFVDADDEVTDCFLAEAESLIRQYAADIIIGAIEYIPGRKMMQGNESVTYISQEHICCMKKALLQLPQSDLKYPILGTPCGRLYKRTCLDGIRFPVGITHWEDQIFNRLVMGAISSAVISPNSWYLYYQNDFSAMHSKLAENYIDACVPFWQYWHQMNEQEIDQQIRKGLRINSISLFYATVNQDLLLKGNSCRQRKKRLENVWNQPIFQDLIKNLTVRDCAAIKDKVRLFCVQKRWYRMIYLLLMAKKMIKKVMH